MVTTTDVDPLDIACHTESMAEALNRPQPDRTQRWLRFSPIDAEFDTLLSEFVRKSPQITLGPHLALISFAGARDDDAKAGTVDSYRAYLMRATKYRQAKFRIHEHSDATPIKFEDGLLQMSIRLGYDAADALIRQPFFDRPSDIRTAESFSIPVNFMVFHPAENIDRRLESLRDFIATAARPLVGQLVVVNPENVSGQLSGTSFAGFSAETREQTRKQMDEAQKGTGLVTRLEEPSSDMEVLPAEDQPTRVA